ncbi:MAG: tRNA pseudouridine(13) synthase TruD [bacterium]|nr:tRNA pseudouridine(13) synthase TruD [bacterium]
MIELPYLTADLPGIGGRIKTDAQDFRVEELPLYRPSGTGTHTYVGIEKTGLTTQQAVSRLAAALDIRPRHVGYAGLKDARAVTCQTLSIEHVDPQMVERLDLPGIRIEWVDRHTNKLKLGHLAGNRFHIKVREVVDPSLPRVEGILEVLTRRGLPNYFGPQRFGRRGDNAAIGRAALQGQYDRAVTNLLGKPHHDEAEPVRRARELFDREDYQAAAQAWPHGFEAERRAARTLAQSDGGYERAWRALDWPSRRLFLSAAQSDLFNRVVARRIDALDRLLPGDLAHKHANGAVFVVDDPGAEQPRADAFEISPSGPLPGRKMKAPQDQAAALEAEVFDDAGLSPALFTVGKGERLDGTRRPLRVRPGEPTAEFQEDDTGPYLQTVFTLPPGSYATVLLREITKTER